MRKRLVVCRAMLCALGALPFAALALGLGAQETKLMGRGMFGFPSLGWSVAISADGNTALAGAPFDNGGGSVAVFIRTGGKWAQQGPKLLPSDVFGATEFGKSVALSADGNTAIIGSPSDDTDVGAVRIFTRSGGVWTQQGNKLVGTGYVGPTGPAQGTSVALSADGNTAIVGGSADNSNAGASWVFTRSAGTWTQQGPKLVGLLAAGDTGAAGQGGAVALSADGNTALVGGPTLSANVGAVWVFTRSSGIWSQQGPRLLGTGGSTARQGRDVALSADGNTALIGGPLDNGGAGAVWVFTRTGSSWTQQGPKLVGTGAANPAQQGASVSLSADGNTALVAARDDNGGEGAVWMFSRNAAVWSQQGPKIVGTLPLSEDAHQGFSARLSGDAATAIVGAPGDYDSVGAAWVFTTPACSLDVDGNQNIDAMTDGLLILRAMFGLTGNAVTDNATAGNATRGTWALLQPYLNGNCGASF